MEEEGALIGSGFVGFALDFSDSMFVLMGLEKLGKFRCPNVVEM